MDRPHGNGRGGRRHTLTVGEAQIGDEVLFMMKCERGGVIFECQEEAVRFPTIGVRCNMKIRSVVCFDGWDFDTDREKVE